MSDILEQTNEKLVIRKWIAASREEVFAAWTDPKSIRRWMCPGDVIFTEAKMDFRVGGLFRIVMKGEKRDFDHSGEYKIIEAPSKLSFTWISQGTDLKTTLVTIELLERDQGTELTLTHEHLPSADRVDRHTRGWAQIADLLAGHLSRDKAQTAS